MMFIFSWKNQLLTLMKQFIQREDRICLKYMYTRYVLLYRQVAVFVLFFFGYSPESQIQKRFLFIETNSFIIFTCPIQFYLSQALGKCVSAKTEVEKFVYFILLQNFKYFTLFWHNHIHQWTRVQIIQLIQGSMCDINI